MYSVSSIIKLISEPQNRRYLSFNSVVSAAKAGCKTIAKA